jgi:hypothetical protein
LLGVSRRRESGVKLSGGVTIGKDHDAAHDVRKGDARKALRPECRPARRSGHLHSGKCVLDALGEPKRFLGGSKPDRSGTE